MKYIAFFMRILCLLLLLQQSQMATAIALIDTKIPASLKNAYDSRHQDPQNCIETISQYITQQNKFADNFKDESRDAYKAKLLSSFPAHLQAVCYAQIEDYSSALNLLQPSFTKPSVSAEQITALNLIALEIPPAERPQLSNPLLLGMLSDTARQIEQKPIARYPNLAVTVQLAIAHLSLQINRYHAAYAALEQAKKQLNKKNNNELAATLAYYYGLYYDQIQQPQLAISALLTANNMADKLQLIKLSGQAKESLVAIYQNRHRFQTALDFAGQQVELYLRTANKIKQAASLMQFAILKRQKMDNNQSLIYLFNALDLIQNNKHSILLARVYLELGRTYISSKSNDKKITHHLSLAQKYLQNARLHFTRLNKPRYLMESLLLLAKLNIINNDPALAILQLEKALQLAENKYQDLRVQAFEMLALSYEITGNHQQAIAHFKNFHALQNRIKEQMFELQQLQISEQLQLFEKTQQQQQLEIKNTQLQQTNERYKRLTYISISLLLLITLLFFYTLKRYKKLNSANQHAQLRLAVHPRTKLPFQHTESNHFQYMYHGTPLYYALLNIPFLSQLNELLGTYGAMKIERKLGKELKSFFSSKVDIFQFRGNQILFIAKQNDYKDAQQLANKIEGFFTVFCKNNELANAVSCGIVAFPFLQNASRALNSSRTLNLSSLALFAASQIREQKEQSSWVELYAIDNLQPAFFNGDLWQLGQRAIAQGIVKVNSSHPNFQFTWPKSHKTNN